MSKVVREALIDAGWKNAQESIAQAFERKAKAHADEHGFDDEGSLSFGRGLVAACRHEHYDMLLELAEEVRGMVRQQLKEPYAPNDQQPAALVDDGFESIDWTEIAKRGLLVRINAEIMHPLGLSVWRDSLTGLSGGALVAPDGKWEYSADQLAVKETPHPVPSAQLINAAHEVLREALDNVSVHPCDVNDDVVRAKGLYGPVAKLYQALTEQQKAEGSFVALMEFYGVNNVADLIGTMEKQIVSLQARIPNPMQPITTSPREG